MRGKKDEHSGSVDEKYKKVNDKLTAKTKELKKAKTQLKEAKIRANDLFITVDKKNKKISELDNYITRLKQMKDHATEAADKKDKPKEDIEDKKNAGHKDTKMMKCKFENTGNCRKNSKCGDPHPMSVLHQAWQLSTGVRLRAPPSFRSVLLLEEPFPM